MWNLIVLVPDHCLFIYSACQSRREIREELSQTGMLCITFVSIYKMSRNKASYSKVYLVPKIVWWKSSFLSLCFVSASDTLQYLYYNAKQKFTSSWPFTTVSIKRKPPHFKKEFKDTCMKKELILLTFYPPVSHIQMVPYFSISVNRSLLSVIISESFKETEDSFVSSAIDSKLFDLINIKLCSEFWTVWFTI